MGSPAALAVVEPAAWEHVPQPLPPPVVQTAAFRDEDIRRLAAAQRSFTTPAVITLVLYIVFWLPGFIANFIYLREANNVQHVTGRTPEGKGCLVAMLWIFGVLPALGFGLLVLLMLA